MKMAILCIIALFLLVTRPIFAQNVKVHVIDECQVGKGMGWGMLIVERGVLGIFPENIFNSGGPWM